MKPLSTYTNSSGNGIARNGLNSLRISIASTFTSNPVEDALTFWGNRFGYHTAIQFSPYDQVFQELLDPHSSLNQPDRDARVVLLRLDDWIRNLADTGESSIHSHITSNIRDLKSFTEKAVSFTDTPIFVSIARSAIESRISPEKQTDYEQVIKNELAGQGNIYVTTSDDIDKTYGVEDYYDLQRDQLGHIPFKQDYFSALGTSVFRTILASRRAPYKVIVLDCDHTLWGGVCGEVPPEKLNLSGPYEFLQAFMLQQKELGKILCLCSKNVQEDVDRVFRERSDMRLREEDFVTAKINWQPKSRNIIELSEELNLGLDSFIFIDDNPVECAEVRANCPDVLTLNLPENSDEFGRYLNHVWVFDTLVTTREDEKRTQRYKENIERAGLQQKSSTLKEFIDGLNLEIHLTDVTPEEIPRVSQLTYRTNQFNFTTIRRSEEQIRELLKNDGYRCIVCSVSDRFGEYGLVGAMLYKPESNRILLDSFMLSCRVLGRGVEHLMLRSIGQAARDYDVGTVQIKFVRTEKNLPARNFLKSVLRGVPGTIPTTRDSYLLRPEDLIGLTFIPDEFPSTEVGHRRSTHEPVVETPGEPRGWVYEQIAKEFHNPSTITRWLTTANGSKGAIRPVASEEEQDPLQIITGIWENLLGRDAIGPDEHFFDVGGTSLKAVEVLSQLNERFNKKLTIVSLFEHSTIRSLTGLVEDKGVSNDEFNKIIQRTEARRNRFRRRG